MDEVYIVKIPFILIGDCLIFNAPLNKRLRIKNKNTFYEIEYDKNITLKLDEITFRKFIEPNVKKREYLPAVECKGE